MRGVALAVACACVLSSVTVRLEPRQANDSQRPVFRLATRLVEVGVIVRDRDGKPVPGLTADDFRVFDAGKEERIEFFRVESGETALTAPPSPSASEFSNRVARRLGAVTVILFDRLNTAFEDQVLARDQIVAFLQQLEPEDRVALYLLESDSVRVIHDFTSDARSLLRALSRVTGTTSRELSATREEPLPAPATGDAQLDAELAAWLRGTNRRIAAEFTRRRAESTTSALEAIAGHLAGVAGRKNLLWVSAGFPRIFREDGFVQTLNREMSRATAAINNANIAIYPVDARGLIGAFTPQTPGRGPQFTTLSTVRPNIDTMVTLAENTGGRAFYNTNDITDAIRQAIDDGRATYVLGYYPSHNRWDATFHELKVRVGRPGVEVRHRKGYLALPEKASDAASREDALRAVVRSPLQATGLGLTVRVERGDAGPEGGIPVVLTVDPEGVTLRPDGERWTGAVDVLLAQDLPGGTVRTTGYFTINLDLTAEQRDRIMTRGVAVSRTIDVLDGAHQVHVLARDVPTGRVGSLIITSEELRTAAGR